VYLLLFRQLNENDTGAALLLFISGASWDMVDLQFEWRIVGFRLWWLCRVAKSKWVVSRALDDLIRSSKFGMKVVQLHRHFCTVHLLNFCKTSAPNFSHSMSARQRQDPPTNLGAQVKLQSTFPTGNEAKTPQIHDYTGYTTQGSVSD